MVFKQLVAAAMACCAMVLAAPSAFAQIKIGFHAPLTGPTAADGQSSLVGAQIAIDWANAKGGLPGKLELASYDDQGKADQAILVANKLIGQDQVPVAVSCGYSLPTRAAAAVFQKAQIPYFAAYAVHPDVTRDGNYAFRGVVLAPAQGHAAAKFVADEFGHKKVDMVVMDNDFGQSIAEGFRNNAAKYGLTLVKEYSFPMSERNFGTIIAGLRGDNPDVIFITAYYFNGGPLVSQIRAAGLTQPIVGAQAFDSTQFINITKEASEGILVIGALGRDRKHPDLARFEEEFRKRTGHDIETVAANCYDGVTLVADAIRRAGAADPKKIRDALAATQNFPALTNDFISFSPSGEVYTPSGVSRITGGTFKSYKTVSDPAILKPTH